jgi:hypothetical protein
MRGHQAYHAYTTPCRGRAGRQRYKRPAPNSAYISGILLTLGAICDIKCYKHIDKPRSRDAEPAEEMPRRVHRQVTPPEREPRRSVLD